MGDSNKLQKALNAAKTTKKNVKDISSGDFAKKKAEEVKNKAKSKLRNKIILLAIKILVPVLIILLIAGFFMAIIGGIGEIVEGVVSAIRGDIDGGTIGECIVRFDEEKFEEMKNTLKANGINPEASNLTDECLKAFILAQYRTQYPTDVKLRIQISDEEYDKIMQKGGAKGYNFVQEGNDRYMQVNGCIKLYRPEFTGNELRYADEESLNKWIDDNNFFQAEQYYSLDKAGNLIIPEKKEEKYIESEWEVQPALIDLENENYDWESFNKRNGQEKIEVTSKKIPYKSLIANYTMPFEFLTLLTTFTQNSEYGMAVAELVNTKSDIEINILDNSKTTEERQTWQTHDYAYINYKIGGNTVIPSKSIWRSYNNYRDFSEFFDREDNMEMLWNPSVYGYPKNIYKVKRANTITTEYTARLQIQKAETWFVKKTSEYAIENIDAHLDESVENNPNIQDIQVPGSNSRIGGSVSENDFTSLEDLYNTNSSFKRFIDIMFEGSVDKFRNEILSQIDYKSIMENYADTYVDHYMKDAFFESELNRACPSPTYDDTYLDNYMANLKNYYNTNDAAIKMYQDYYSGVKNIILDYKNKSRDWKIDSNSYEVLPSNFNYERKKYQLKNENYVSEKKYNEIMGKNEDNTDDFISLLVTENAGEKEYVYYETQSGKKAPLADILSAPDMFFELIANNSKTARLENAMRYILYKITDKDYGVTDFNKALYSMQKFGTGNVLYDYIRIRENYTLYLFYIGETSSCEYVTANHYKTIADPSAGLIDFTYGVVINPAWHDEEFAEFGVTPEQVRKYTQDGMEVTELSHEQAEKFFEKCVDSQRNSVKESISSGIELDDDQINALTMISYAFGNIGNFNDVYYLYKEGKKEEFKSSFSVQGVNVFNETCFGWDEEDKTNTYKMFSEGFYEANGIVLDKNSYKSSGITGRGGTVVEKAIECHKYLRENGYTYGGGYSIPDGIYNSSKIVDCSAYVSWVLYEAGYDSFNAWQETYFAGNHHELVEVSENEIQPGDVLVYPSHVELAAQVENGIVTRVYNCGSDSSISSAGTDDCPESSPAWQYNYVVILRAP